MPRLSVWAVRTALLYLLIGFTFGALLLANKGQPFWDKVWYLLPVHIEFLLVGWMINLAFGVAFWILPRLGGGSRGNERFAQTSFFLLNVGVLLVALQEISLIYLIIGRLLELLSGILFALHAWKRIRPLVFS